MNRIVSSFLLLAMFALLLVSASGSATTDPANASVRPWDAPVGWENGIPSNMYQNR